MVAPVTGPSRVIGHTYLASTASSGNSAEGAWLDRGRTKRITASRADSWVWHGLVSPGPKASPLLGLNLCGRAFEFDDQFLETRVLAEALQIVISHQVIGILISAVDAFP